MLLFHPLFAKPTAAQSYKFTTIDTPAGLGWQAQGINDLGEVVGSSLCCGINVQFQGLLLSGGNFTGINCPNVAVSGTFASGINNLGQIVGTCYVNPSVPFGAFQFGFLFAGGNYSTFEFPGAVATAASGINDNGQVVGSYYLPAGCLGCTTLAQGFVLSGGAFGTIDFPGAEATLPLGINNVGQIVGIYYGVTGGSHGFLLNGGVFTAVDFPGSSFTTLAGINSGGEMVGFYGDPSGTHGFLLRGGSFSTIDFPGASATAVWGINDNGRIVGWSETGFNLRIDAFIGDRETPLLDPVPDLLDGAAVTTNNDLLATGGRLVQGVAADGVTQVVVRIPAQNAGDQFTLKLLNDQGQSSTSLNDDGGLGSIGQGSLSSQIATAAVSTPNGPMAFAVYRAPMDFPRTNPPSTQVTCGGVTGYDADLPCRTVSIQVQDTNTRASSTTTVTILRPLVALIHGIWSNPTDTWGNFAAPDTQGRLTPLRSDSRFTATTVEYDSPVAGLVSASSPSYSSGTLKKAKTNALGFAFNAPLVLNQLQVGLEVFRRGGNRLGIPVAAIQTDVVAHSMGGNITREVMLQQSYGDVTFGQGIVHKMITINTPHLGTPVAEDILQTNNTCVRKVMASTGSIAFQTVVTPSGTFDGAVLDLQGDGKGISVSDAINRLRNSNPHPLPTAMLAGIMDDNNLSGLGNASKARKVLHDYCGVILRDPLGLALTPTGWRSVFGQDNDAIVPLTSHVNGLMIAPLPGGYVHSRGTEALGFNGPSVVDPGTFPTHVINLLNTPVNDPKFNQLAP